MTATRRDWLMWAALSLANWGIVVPLSIAAHLSHVWPGPLTITVLNGLVYLVAVPRRRAARRHQRGRDRNRENVDA